jgi:1-deoxy-D-xylulose-5-phosphate synthase
VLELFQERGIFSVQVKRLGVPDLFVEHGPQSLLREKYGIDENGIFTAVKEMAEEEKSPSIHPNQTKTPVIRMLPNPE